jgi:hypothetical protein
MQKARETALVDLLWRLLAEDALRFVRRYDLDELADAFADAQSKVVETLEQHGVELLPALFVFTEGLRIQLFDVLALLFCEER